MNNLLIVVEGNHDIAYLHKILQLVGYSVIKNVNDLNSFSRNYLPSKFPFRGDSLNIFNHVPYYFRNGDNQIVILNADGETNILQKLDDALSGDLDTTILISNILIIADGDLNNKDEKKSKIIDIDFEEKDFEFLSKDHLENEEAFVDIRGHSITIELFVLPNNSDKGRLEDVILEGIENKNPDLLELTEEMLGKIDAKYKSNWDDRNSKFEKAKIGIVGNILIPSASNTTLISSNRIKWISTDSIQTNRSVKALYECIIKLTS